MSRSVFQRLLLLLGLLPVAAAFAAQEDAMDIVGLRLGMTQAEATAALQAYSPAMKLQVVEGFYNYTDGVNQLATPNFVSRIEGYLPSPLSEGPNFVVLLTPPPEGGKVWAVERRERVADNPPSIVQFKQSLLEKYGTPAGESRNGAAVVWKLPGSQPNCLQNPSDVAYPQFSPIGDREVETRLQYAQQTRRAPADLGECAKTLHYALETPDGQTLGRVQAVLLDVATYARASAAATAEVTALEEAARKTREAGAKGPRL
jgi:hypothetical protein